MTHRLVIYEALDEILWGPKTYVRMLDLRQAGHPVQVRELFHSGCQSDIIIKAWIDFETEADMAIFKLTHL